MKYNVHMADKKVPPTPPKDDPLVRLKISTSRGKRGYIEVWVYKTSQAMQASARVVDYARRGEWETGLNRAVFFAPPIEAEDVSTAKCLGLIIFSLKHFDPATIGHEFLHATICWAKMSRINPMDDSEEGKINGVIQEEVVVTCHDELVTQFWKKIAASNILNS